MTRGKQKIEAQKRNAEKNQKPKGSQMDARAAALKFTCPICKALWDYQGNRYTDKWLSYQDKCVGYTGTKVQLANQNQIADHYSSKHPKEKAPQPSE